MPSLALLQKHDSKLFRETFKEDPAGDGVETEGGYVITRARHNRGPRRIFTLGFTDLSDAEKESLMAFYFATRGSAVIIDGWQHPVSDATIPVRFKMQTIPTATYKGAGTYARWDVSGVTLEEV